MNLVLRILGGLIILYAGLNLFIAISGTWGMVRNAMYEFEYQRNVLGSEAAPVEKGERLALWLYLLSIPPVRSFFWLWLPAFFLGLAVVIWA